MINSTDVLSGKILEPSCGSGNFLVKIIERIISELKAKDVPAEEILDYICDNIQFKLRLSNLGCCRHNDPFDLRICKRLHWFFQVRSS